MNEHEAELQSIFGFVIVWMIEKAKHSNWSILSWISASSALLSRGLSIAVAIGVGAGITYSVTQVESGYDISIHAPNVETLIHFAISSGWQMINQEVQYRAIFNRSKQP